MGCSNFCEDLFSVSGCILIQELTKVSGCIVHILGDSSFVYSSWSRYRDCLDSTAKCQLLVNVN